MKKLTQLFLFNLAICMTSFANDSTGTIAAGGIQFTQSPSIKMLSEELTISIEQVKVSYLFKNLSDQPIATTVFFPLPPYQDDGNLWDINSIEEAAEGAKKNAPVVNFSVIVEGKSVPFKVSVAAITEDGKDITQILKQAGIPLFPELGEGSGFSVDYQTLEGEEYKQYEEDLKQWKAKSQQLGLLDKEGNARWKKQVTYYWDQVFPTGKTISITHQYKPARGGFYEGIGYGDKDEYFKSIGSRLKELFDMEFASLENKIAFQNWIASYVPNLGRSQPLSNNLPTFYFYNVGYILTTGANWAGPIEQFTLNLEYPPDGVVAYAPFYDDPSAKIVKTPRQLKILLNNFTPKQDLNIIFGNIYIP